MNRPVRLRLSRRRGFKLQEHSRAVNGLSAVNVVRPSKFGNPFVIMNDPNDRERVIKRFRNCLIGRPSLLRHKILTITRGMEGRGEGYFERMRNGLAELEGKNLACWCHLCPKHAATGKPFDELCPDCAPCHADVLGRRANAIICEG